MKKILLLIAATAILALSSCSKEVTPVNGDTLPTKATVSGHARYCTYKQNNTLNDPLPVKKGTVINVFYGTPDTNGDIQFAYTSTTTDKNGYFEIELGCPVGKTLTVKVNAMIEADSFATPSTGGSAISTDSYLFGEVSQDIPCGGVKYFDLILLPTANFGNPGLTQP